MRNSFRRIVLPLCALPLAAVTLLVACGDGSEPTGPSGITGPPDEAQLALRDARNTGVPGFYFLPPIAPPTAYPGTFDPNRAPVVEICAWSGTACTGPLVASYARTTGTGGTTIRVDGANQLYRVDWPTTSLQPGQLYRIRVLEGTTELGHADAKIPGPGERAVDLLAQQIVPLGNSPRLAIRFRIEQNEGTVVTITAPQSGTVVPPGTSVRLTGTATDPEEGDLSSEIVWRSDRIPEPLGVGASLDVLLPGGPHEISASVTDANGVTTMATIQLVVSAVSVPTTLNVPYGGSASLPITLGVPAPAGGATFTVTSDAPGRVGVAPASTTVTVPEGQQAANATLLGVSPGTATVTVSSEDFGSATSAVTTTASLDIVETSVSFPTTRTGNFTVRLLSDGAEIAAPAGGIAVSFASSNPACATAAPITIGEGLVNAVATVAYAGTAASPCSASLVASVPGIPAVTTDVVSVSVGTAPSLTVNSTNVRVGSGLRDNVTVTLGAPAPAGGLEVTLTSATPGTLLVSASAGAVGQPSAAVTVAAGGTSAIFHLHGVESQTGTVTLTATAEGYADGTNTAAVVPIAFDLVNLASSISGLAGDDPFQLRVGSVNAAGTGIQTEQEVRPGSSGLAFTVTSSDPAVGLLTTTAGSAASRTVTLLPGASRTPFSVAAGGIAFDPRAAGSTTVAATTASTASTPTDGASQLVTVTGSTIVVNSAGVRIGSGLRESIPVQLGVLVTSPVAVTLTSSDPSVLLVSTSASAVGQASATATVPTGNNGVSFHLHGIENRTGTVTLTATAEGFGTGTNSVVVVPITFDILGLPTTVPTLAADDPFQVRVGALAATGSTMANEQPVRPGSPGLVFTVTSSNPAAAQLVTSAGTAASRTVTLAAGSSRTPPSVAAGGVALDPIATGSTTISATTESTVNTPIATSSQMVTVSGSALTVNSTGTRVGSGLLERVTVSLGAPAPPGGVEVTLASSDVTKLLVSTSASAVGQSAATVTVPAGNTSVNFFLHGIENTTGTVTLTATAEGYGDGTNTVFVAPVTFDILGLPATSTTLSPDDVFQLRVGALSAAGTTLQAEQVVRPASPGITFTVTNSNPAVGQLVTAAGAGQSRTVTLQSGLSRTPGTVAAGGIAFDPIGTGSTTVAATTASTVSTPIANSSQTVTVTAPGISLGSAGTRIGGGLRERLQVSLSAPAPAGGLEVTLTSSNPGVLLLSPADNVTAGQGSITLDVPAGSTSIQYYANGVEGQTGTVTITATAPGFTDGTTSVTVTPVAYEILALPTSLSAGAPDDVFQVRVGALSTTGNAMAAEQSVRVGGPLLTFTISSSNPAAARLVTSAGAAASRTVTIPLGSSRTGGTVAADGIALDPLAVGSTIITATSGAAFTVALPNATVGVNITP